MENNQDITVGITSYNCENTIRRAIDSALRAGAVKLLIYDDGSTDGTPNILEELSGSDHRINFVRRKKNLGVATARNELLIYCETEYLAFLDDDDEMIEGRLSAQKAAFDLVSRRFGTDNILCYGARRVINRLGITSYGTGLGADKPISGVALALYALVGIRRGGFAPGLFGSGTLFVKPRALLSIGGFDVAYRRCEDVELAVSAAREGFYVTSCEDEVILQHKTEGSDKGARIELAARNRIIRRHLGYIVGVWPLLPVACWLCSFARHLDVKNPALAKVFRMSSVFFWPIQDVIAYLRR